MTFSGEHPIIFFGGGALLNNECHPVPPGGTQDNVCTSLILSLTLFEGDRLKRISE
jgi:hypothetical protein